MERRRKLKLAITGIGFFLLIFFLFPKNIFAYDYYVDSNNGQDGNDGLSESRAWKTLAPVKAKNFVPGDSVNFRRGSVWADGLIIDNSGLENNPIIFRTYGTGSRPIIKKPAVSGENTTSILVYASWVVVEGFSVQDTSFSGVYLWKGSDNNIIRDIEVTAHWMSLSFGTRGI